MTRLYHKVVSAASVKCRQYQRHVSHVQPLGVGLVDGRSAWWVDLLQPHRAKREREKLRAPVGVRGDGHSVRLSTLLFIIIESDLPRHRRAVPFYEALAGLGRAKDIVVHTPAEVAEWRTASCSLVATVLREGQVLYENQS